MKFSPSNTYNVRVGIDAVIYDSIDLIYTYSQTGGCHNWEAK